MKILIIEDSEEIAEGLKFSLEREKFSVDISNNFDNAKKDKTKRINECDVLLYVITPQQKGFTSIASAVDYSNKFPNKLVFCVLYKCNDLKFEGHLLESIRSVEDIIKDNGCRVYNSLEDVANYLNNISD